MKDLITPNDFENIRKTVHRDKVNNLVKIMNTGLTKGQNRFHFPSEVIEAIIDASDVFRSIGFSVFVEEYLLFYGKPHTEVMLACSKEELGNMIETKRFKEWLFTTKNGKDAQKSVSNMSVGAQHNLLLKMYRKQCI